MLARTKQADVKRIPPPEGESMSLEEFLSLDVPQGDIVVEIDGVRVGLTSLDRVYYPESGITKGELLQYYARISDHILPYLNARPAILQRKPRGIKAPGFFQHDINDAPDFLRVAKLKSEEGRDIDYAVYSSLASLLYLVNLGTIEQHPFHSTVDDLEHPDWLALDLDPRGAPWENVLQTAMVTREVLLERDIRSYVKTSGSQGIHILIPLEPVYSYEEVADYAHELADEITHRAEKVATIERSIAGRKKGQVYVDWLQNAYGKTLAAPFSARAKPGATVSMPLRWDQVDQGVTISEFTIRTVPDLLKKRPDPWANMLTDRQRLIY